MENKKIAFFLSTDNKMIAYAEVLTKSIQEVYGENNVSIFISIDETVEKMPFYLLENKNIEIINIEKTINEGGLQHLKANILFGRITYLAYARLFITKLIDCEKYKTVVYIDVDGLLLNKIPDIYINSSLNFSFFPSNNESGAKDTLNWVKGNLKTRKVKNRIIKKIARNDYFQSGLIIINNFKKYRKLENKSKKYLLNNIEDKIDDQNLMNFLNKNNIIVKTDGRINYRPDFSSLVSAEEVIFLHFAGKNKPLNSEFEWKNFSEFKCDISRWYYD